LVPISSISHRFRGGSLKKDPPYFKGVVWPIGVAAYSEDGERGSRQSKGVRSDETPSFLLSRSTILKKEIIKVGTRVKKKTHPLMIAAVVTRFARFL
jgi:hypothetical protein